MKAHLSIALLILLLACNNSTPEQFTVTEYPASPVVRTNLKPVYIHYMPWFESPEYAEYPETSKGNWGVHWTMANRNPTIIDGDGKRQIASHYYPLVEPYDNGEKDYLEYAVVCMKLTGVDGVLIDYAGITPVYDWKLLHDHTMAIIPWLEKAGLKFGLVYEDASLKNAFNQNIITDKVTEGKRVMAYFKDNFFSKSNYLKIGANPVLLNFGPQALFTDAEWTSVFSGIQPVSFITLPYTIGNYGLNTSAKGEFAWVGETVNDTFYQHCTQYSICVGGAMPGFNDYYKDGGWGNGYTFYDDKNGQLFTETLQRASNNAINLLQIITWNDYGEGTIVEPTREFGYSRLMQIQAFLGVTYRETELALAVSLYKKRKANKGKDLENKKLDQVFYYLISLQLDKAGELLSKL